MKHENAYPPHRPTFWLVLKSNKIFIIWKTKLCKETGIGKRYFCEFAMARQTWFSTENSSLYCASELVFTTKLPFFLSLYFFLYIYFIYFLFYLLAVSDQLRSRWRRNTDVSIQHFHFFLLWNLLYKICLVDRFVVQLEPVAIDHKCTCFIIYGLEFNWTIIIDFKNLIWTKPVSSEFGFEVFKLWVKQ